LIGAARAGKAKFSAKNLDGFQTRQYPANYYLSWFHRLFSSDEFGWSQKFTADGLGMSEQDTFLQFSMEEICRYFNEQIAAQRAKKTPR
jgi:hypothetical protein